MTGPASSPASPSKTEVRLLFGCWLAVIPTVVVMLLIPNPIQHAFCPRETIVSGLLVGGGLVAGSLLAGASLFIAPLLCLRARQQGRLGRARLSAGVGILVFVLGLCFWFVDIFNYYCATPENIRVHRAFAQGATYEWSGVQQVRAACFPGAKGGMSISFMLEMPDRTWVDLGGDSIPSLAKHYDQVAGLVRAAPYDNALIDKCPSGWRSTFAKHPG